MSVLLSLPLRAMLLGDLIFIDPFLEVYSGAMPSNINQDITSFRNQHAASALVVYIRSGTNFQDGLTIKGDVENKGVEMTISNLDSIASNTGTASWFLCYPPSGQPYDFFVSDSISLTGGNGILQLQSLSFTSGQLAPEVTDFAVSIG